MNKILPAIFVLALSVVSLRATLSASNAQQYRADTGATIPDPSGTVPNGVGVYFDCAATDTTGATIQMQVELLKLPATFTGTPNYTSSFVSSGSRPRTSTATGLSAGNYGWRYRVINSSGVVGTWVPANNPDFIVQTAVAPSISSLSPTTMSPLNGNQTLTIYGNNFVAGDTLTFVPPEGGTIPSTASKLTVNSSGQITYQINNSSDSGNWTVTVNSPDGTQHSSAAGFVVSEIAPSISSLSPTTMPPLNGNQTLTIYGNNFVAGDTLSFVPPEGGTIPSTASKLTVNSNGQITYQINNSADSGNWTVTVNSPNGTQHSSAMGFVVSEVGPSISSLLPTAMSPLNGNQTLTIYGNNFVAGDTLTFMPPEGGTIPSTASKLTVNSSSQITYQINNSGDSGNWTVTVNSPDNTEHSSAVAFAVTGITTTTEYGVDYRNPFSNAANATTGIDISGLKSAGKVFVCEYLGLTSDDGYLRSSDVQALSGLAIVSIYERTPKSISYFTIANADTDASGAIQAALLAGQPSGTAIYFTVDYPADDQASISSIDTYFQEIRIDFNQYFAANPGVNYTIGVYGPASILPTLMNDPSVGASFSWVADPFGSSYSQANLEQTTDDALTLDTVNFDFDTAHTTDFGQWSLPQVNISPNQLILAPSSGGTAGADSSFVVSGIGLGEGAAITLTAPTGSELSMDGVSGFAPTLTLNSIDSGNLAPITLYARIAANTLGNISGELTVSDSVNSQASYAILVTGSASTGNSPSAPLMINPARIGNSFSVSVATQSGFSYDLKYKVSISDVEWSTVTTVSGNGGVMTLQDAAATNSTGFYIVVAH